MDNPEYAAKIAWLRRYGQAKDKEQTLYRRFCETRSQASNISSGMGGARRQTASGASGIERAVERTDNARAKWMEQNEVRRKLYLETRKAIYQIKNENLRKVLELRYLAGFTMTKVAINMQVSIRWAQHLHGQAIETLDTSP